MNDNVEVELTREYVINQAAIFIRRNEKSDYVIKYTKYLVDLLVKEVKYNLKQIDKSFKFCYQFTVDTMLLMVDKDGEFATKYKLFNELYGNTCTEEMEFYALRQIPIVYRMFYTMYPLTRF